MAKITTVTEPWSELQHYLLGGEYRGPFYEVPDWRSEFYPAVFDPLGQVQGQASLPPPTPPPAPVRRKRR